MNFGLLRSSSSGVTLKGFGVAGPTLVGLVRVELTTSRLSGVRSNHLSYRPVDTFR